MAAYLRKSRTVELAVPAAELGTDDIVRTRSGRILTVARVARRGASVAVWFDGAKVPAILAASHEVSVLVDGELI